MGGALLLLYLRMRLKALGFRQQKGLAWAGVESALYPGWW